MSTCYDVGSYGIDDLFTPEITCFAAGGLPTAASGLSSDLLSFPSSVTYFDISSTMDMAFTSANSRPVATASLPTVRQTTTAGARGTPLPTAVGGSSGIVAGSGSTSGENAGSRMVCPCNQMLLSRAICFADHPPTVQIEWRFDSLGDRRLSGFGILSQVEAEVMCCAVFEKKAGG